jgi:heme oxygenase
VTPIVERLRASTRSVHERVEAPFAALLSESPSRALYGEFLSAMWSFHSGVGLSPERVEHLERDLRALGLPMPTARCRAPSLDTPSHVFGARYVIEGSALGGRVLYRHLSPRLDISHERGARFLYGVGERTGTEFRALVASIAAHVDEGGDPDAVEAGALATFGSLLDLLGG